MYIGILYLTKGLNMKFQELKSLLNRRFQLSSYHCDIVTMAAIGLSNKEIANQLFVSERDVKSCLNEIYDVMNLKSRAQLIVWCLPHMGQHETY